MLTRIYICFTLFFGVNIPAQNPCQNQFIYDSVIKPGDKVAISVNALTCPIKNGAVQFINQNEKLYLRLKINDKLGFIADGALELMSGTKSIVFKTSLHNINKVNPYFIVDVGINYIATLKDNGLTGLIFNSHEVKFEKTDTKNIRETAGCFYTINNKKNSTASKQ